MRMPIALVEEISSMSSECDARSEFSRTDLDIGSGQDRASVA
jgi:hypothetical protein